MNNTLLTVPFDSDEAYAHGDAAPMAGTPCIVGTAVLTVGLGANLEEMTES